jgi:phosphonopyruvate decarboxylase
MHMGNMSTAATSGGANFKHIIINNGAHDSVGGQPTDAANGNVDLCAVARGVGYREVMTAVTPEEIADCVENMRTMDGPVLLEVKVNKGGRKDLGRPTRTPIQNKADFMHFLAID